MILGDRNVAVVRRGVQSQCMRTIGQKGRTPQRQVALIVIEDADPAAFGSDIDTVSARIVGQYVGRFADSVVVNHVFRLARSTVTIVALASQPTNITCSVTSRA